MPNMQPEPEVVRRLVALRAAAKDLLVAIDKMVDETGVLADPGTGITIPIDHETGRRIQEEHPE